MTHAAPPRPERGRPREFDIAAVIERAMGVFWTRGYYGTSLPDLLKATRLSRGSLYAAFGDKRGLLLQALDRYSADALIRLDAELACEGEALAGIRACLVGYVERTCGSAGARGCLVVSTAMELAAHDADIKERISAFFDGMKRRFAKTLVRAQRNGELARGVDPTVAAHLIMCLVEGMRVVGKTRPDRSTSLAMIETLLASLSR